ncbi:hypothetical protein [Sediminicoccus rosea]|jgi:hypothetical protein|uniref:Secreted protein n=1 Tax=Sediminicoccus rosea TaxID=1225128 RepID=A0ABZ0PGG5_9PROT|nr:hypothetical protein [Sediminicoccus rosea]WPB84443.1 hypothetical protein R9Z33_20400 [Sediminicoccus rosea]
MTFFSSGVIGFGADAATAADAIPNPFFFQTKTSMQTRAGAEGRPARQCRQKDRMVVAETLRWIKLRVRARNVIHCIAAMQKLTPIQ